MIPDPAPPYELGASDLLRERIERMLARAAGRGIRPEIERSLNEILEQMVMNPRGWGDPIRDLRNARQVEFHGRHDRILAIYTVHDRVPVVFLWKLIPRTVTRSTARTSTPRKPLTRTTPASPRPGAASPPSRS